MIPNWLLGKSKSKLQEILGGGGGGGTTYTAGEGIDITNDEISVDPVLLSDIFDMGYAILTKAAKTQITNPNILHNPWFQVNQRGVTSASANGYFVDRWRLACATTGTTTYTLNSDGTITIDNSLGEGPAYFVQRRTAETISRVTGKKITASVMLNDDSVRAGSGTYVSTETTNYYEDDDIKIQSIAQTAGQFFALRVEAGKTITIKALKLELGEISTLAMDTAPDMACELAKCQRYFVVLKGDLLRLNTLTTNKVFFLYPLPEQMRAVGSINVIGTPIVKNMSGAEQSDFTFVYYLRNNNQALQIEATKANHGLTDAYVNCGPDYLYIDAEL